jgi:glyoxylase-like metal-dependent hydrolase (beta-lactamase superfamily II)
VRELQPGVWHWEARHPDWKEGADWSPAVSSYAIDDGKHLLLFDPIAPPSLVDEVADGREPVIVLTCPWHVRDAQSLSERLGAPIHVPPPDEGDTEPVRGEVFTAGDRLHVGVEARPGLESNDLVLWIESHRALVAGDTLIDRGNGLEIPTDWAEEGMSAEQIRDGLQPLLDLPVELVLATHGGAFDRAALERALA